MSRCTFSTRFTLFRVASIRQTVLIPNISSKAADRSFSEQNLYNGKIVQFHFHFSGSNRLSISWLYWNGAELVAKPQTDRQ